MQHHQLPAAAATHAMSVNDLMNATMRLSDILNEEAELLSAMRYGEIGALQDEKVRLSKLLESYQQLMASDPNFVKNADEKTREELLLLTDDLAFGVEENFRKVATARAVNQRVMQAIMDVMTEQQRPSTYGRDGQSAQGADMALSINLNEKA